MSFYGTTNRLLPIIEKRRAQLAAGVKPDGTPITVDLVEFEKGLDLSIDEFVQFQNVKSWAQLTELITLDEAMTVYAALGEVPGASGWSDSADLAAKLVLTSFFGELLAKKIAARR